MRIALSLDSAEGCPLFDVGSKEEICQCPHVTGDVFHLVPLQIERLVWRIAQPDFPTYGVVLRACTGYSHSGVSAAKEVSVPDSPISSAPKPQRLPAVAEIDVLRELYPLINVKVVDLRQR